MYRKTIFILSCSLAISIILPFQTKANSFYPAIPSDKAAIYLTSELFPVHADGIGDDTPALQQAIDKVASTTGSGILFIPEGTYRLTDTVNVWPGIRLIGCGRQRPVFTLAENTTGYQRDKKHMLFFAGGRGDNGPRDGNPGTFYSAMSNINIKIKPGNPAAIAIRFHVAQHCFLSHMELWLSDAKAGLEDIGNEIEDLHFHNGQYGIITGRSAPGWPILIIDSSFDSQTQAAITSNEGGLAIVRPIFKNTPTAVSIAPETPDQLWISDAVMENISGPAVIISDKDNARTQVNLQNITCRNVPNIAIFRQNGKKYSSDTKEYIITIFSHGRQLSSNTNNRTINTICKTSHILQPHKLPSSDIPSLPDQKSWVNVCSLGAIGDNQTDNTAILQKAIAEHSTLYFPSGWYRVSDTLTLKPDTTLIGLHPLKTAISILDSEPAFQRTGSPKPVIEAPQRGSNIITGIGVYTGQVNNRAVGVKWMAGPKSMINDVRFHGGHGTLMPGQTRYQWQGNRDAWSSQQASLWVTNGGGGTFKDIWTPNPHASCGMKISDTSTSGRIYAMSLEHHVNNEMIISNVANWKFFAAQFEEEREEGPHCLPVLIENSNNLLFANTFFYRVISSYVPFPYAAKISGSRDIIFCNFHSYSNSKVSFDSAVYETTSNTTIWEPEFASLNITGKQSTDPLIYKPSPSKLAGGFLNISGPAVDSKGRLYFTDQRKGYIYRWSDKTQQAELIREIPQQPVQLAFDKSDNLLVIAYQGNGTVLTFRPDDQTSEIISINAQPSQPLPGSTAFLPANRWMGNSSFARNSTETKPFHFISPDNTIFIPAGNDFTSGATSWGIKSADIIRAFQIFPAAIGSKFYVTNELELKTWSFDVKPDGTLTNQQLFANEGGETVITDTNGKVYIAAGQIMVFDPSGKHIDTINVPQRPTAMIFGGPDRNILYITARSSLYSIQI